MNIYLALALCFLPLVLAVVAAKLSSGTPALVLLLCVLLGLVIVVPVSVVEGAALKLRSNVPAWAAGLSAPVASLVFCIAAVGLVEEVSKALVLLALPVRRAPLTDLSALLCALVFGLSVGCFESAAYLVDAIDKASNMGSHPIYSSIFQRIFTADMLHAFCAALGGVFILSIKREEAKTDTAAIVWAILIHGVYDFLVINSRYKWLSAAAILLAAVEMNSHYRRLARRGRPCAPI